MVLHLLALNAINISLHSLPDYFWGPLPPSRISHRMEWGILSVFFSVLSANDLCCSRVTGSSLNSSSFIAPATPTITYFSYPNISSPTTQKLPQTQDIPQHTLDDETILKLYSLQLDIDGIQNKQQKYKKHSQNMIYTLHLHYTGKQAKNK